MTILLLVEDDADHRQRMLGAIAEVSTVDVVSKVDGSSALEYLQQFNPKTSGAPAAIFLDLSMPCVSGFDVLRQLRHHADACHIPVLVFTESEREVDVYLSYHLGANAYVVKPRDPEEFKRTISLATSFWLNTNVRSPRR